MPIGGDKERWGKCRAIDFEGGKPIGGEPYSSWNRSVAAERQPSEPSKLQHMAVASVIDCIGACFIQSDDFGHGSSLTRFRILDGKLLDRGGARAQSKNSPFVAAQEGHRSKARSDRGKEIIARYVNYL